MRACLTAILLSAVTTGAAAQEPPPLPLPAVPEPAAEAPAVAAGPMTVPRLGRLLEDRFRGTDIQGQGGAWRIVLPEADEPAGEQDAEQEDADDAQLGPGAGDHLPPIVLVLTDARANRMRIMMPIRPFDPQQAEDLRLALIALHANYDRALDARYAIQDGVLWSVFIHPLRSLTTDDLDGAIRQVQGLRENTGTSYSSGELQFGGGGPPQEPPAPSPDDPSRV